MARKSHEEVATHDEATHEDAKHENVMQEEGQEFNEESDLSDESSVDDLGQPTIKIGGFVFAAPDKYLAGHVMTDEEAVHYSNFIRSRCSSNMISLEKRNKRVWTPETAAAYYAEYVLGAPRGRGPTDEEVRDEALDALLEQIATERGEVLPRGKGSKAILAEYKAKIGASPKFQQRIAELELEVRAAYAEKNKAPEPKAPTLDLADLLT